MDFSKHRLTNDADLLEYRTKMGAQPFWEYANRLYKKVLSMNPDESFRIEDVVVEENRDMFIKLLCWFIQSGLAVAYLFNEEFTVFKRMKIVKLNKKNDE